MAGKHDLELPQGAWPAAGILVSAVVHVLALNLKMWLCKFHGMCTVHS